MKQSTYLLLSIIPFLFFACNSSESGETTASSTSQTMTEFVQLAFEGALKAKSDIPVAMKLNKSGQNLHGQMLYKKIGKPIEVNGTIDDAGTISLKESIDDEITGYYEGQIVNNVFNGIWKSGDKKRSLDFSMNVSDNDFSSFVKKEKILEYTGLYEIKPEEGRDADYQYTFEIEHLSENNIKFLFYGNRGKPSYNMGSIEGEAVIKGNIATFENNEYGDCAFQLKFGNNGLEALYLDNKNECGFGFGVYLEGDYKKTSSDKPKFENPMR